MTPKEIRLSDVFHISGPMFIVSGAVGGAEPTPRSRYTKQVLPLHLVPPDSPPFSSQLLKMAYNDIAYICIGLIRYASTDSDRRGAFYPLDTYPRW